MALGLTLDRSWREVMLSAGWGGLNAIVSVSLAMILLPPAEELTGIDTYLKLLEWSDLNRPLLQRLSLEAPGTYAHTIAMANLVEAARERDRRQRAARPRRHLLPRHRQAARSRSTSWRTSRGDATRTTS